MSESSEFQTLLQRASGGDEDATAELIRRYEPEVRVVARARLSKQLRPYLDSVDITQSVHRSLMAGLRADRFDIASPDKLIGLAVVIVRRKIARHWRKLRRQQRDSQTDATVPREHVAAENAEGAVEARDEFEQLTAELPEIDRELLELRMSGYSTAEAARKLELDPDVVRVRLSRLRSKLREKMERTDA